MDGGSGLSLISATLAAEQGLVVDPLPHLMAEAANGGSMAVYGTTVAHVTVTDSRGHHMEQDIPLVVTDLQGYKMYLGLPWIDEFNPKLRYRARRFYHRGVKDSDTRLLAKVAIECAEEFERTMRKPSTDVYAVLVAYIGQLGPIGAKEAPIPEEYAEFADLGSEEDFLALPEHGPQDLAINLVDGCTPPWRPLYNLSATELQILRKYIEDYMQRGWIRHSRSPAGAPILFAKKKDGTLRLCVDYRELNKITIKNRHPLPLISESLERLAGANIYTKLDIREAYHMVRIKEGDEWKTAFRTRYGHFEYTVMPFGLTNAPAQFQAYINQILAGLIDIICVVYLDDILIFSDTEEEHVQHVREVLRRLRKARLFVKLGKCEWHTRETEYLGYIVSREGIKVDPDRVKTITDWPVPKTVRDIRVFVGFMNYYRRFIAQFSKIALPLTKLTQKGPNAAKGGHAQRKEESQALDIGAEGKAAFEKMKDAFLGVPILAHFERNRPTKVEVDASGGAISGILSQLVPNDDQKDSKGKNGAEWRPIDFYSCKLIQAEYNYDTHDQELLAITKSLQHWRHYLEGLPFELLTDHNNLRWFMETKELNNRQVRSYQKLTKFDFVISHRPGKTNPADGPSRRPDYMEEAHAPWRKYNEAYLQPMKALLSRTTRDPPTMVASMTLRSTRKLDEPNTVLPKGKIGAKPPKAFNERSEESEVSASTLSDTSDTTDDEVTPSGPNEHISPQKVVKTLTTVQEKVDALRECHDDPMAGHFGYKKTLEKLQRRYRWPNMRKDVTEYCKECLHCNRSMAPKHKPYGLLQPLPPPTGPFQEVTMDFIPDLPPSKFMGVVYNAILVIVCRLTKMAHYIPARMDWEAEDLAKVWIRDVIRPHGVPERVISDRGPLMKSKNWDSFNHYLNARRVLSSSYHPETDGQTERQNQTLEQYLRCYCCLEQDDWASWLPIAEFAYNDSVHATTGITPFRAYHGADPRAPNWPGMPLGEGESPLGKGLAAHVIALQAECRRKIIAANAYQKAYADKKRKPLSLKIGDKVLVSSRHMRSTRPKKKLDWKYLGPGTVVGQLGPAAFKVELPGLNSVHPVFHASLLEPYTKKGTIPHDKEPIVDTLREYGDDVYDVEEVLDRRLNAVGVWEYLIKWKDYPEEENSWEPGPNINEHALQKFWQKKGILAKRISKKPTATKKPGRGRPPKKKGDSLA